jgi:hypothetical protein
MGVNKKTKVKEVSEERQTIVMMVLEGDLPPEAITEDELEFVQEALWDVLAEIMEHSLRQGQHSLH